MARIWRPLGRVPAPAWEWGLRRLPVPPVTLATVHREDAEPGPAGWIVVVPVGARQLLAEDRRWVLGRIERAVDRAQRLGAEIVGLGALTAPATGAGRLLRERPGLTLTTGNAFTAHLTVEALRRLLPAAPGAHLAIVGATGSVGSCVVRLLADEPLGADLTLVARGARRLGDLAADIRERDAGIAVRTSTSMDVVRDADLVLVLTSAVDAVLTSAHLKTGAIVLDDTQPRNTDPALQTERPDVLVIDGGIAAIPGIDVRGDIGLPRGLAYACLCETMLMAFDGGTEQAIGEASVDHAVRMRDAARRFAHLGFTLADPLSFGRPVAWPSPAREAVLS
ncbi:semialdehyde dehydrogenase [Microbacterium ulmi]|uniref:Semialdehyde dehydrogenase n=2 Tax=Microbacterium ulmi TaxID=179095 RepID=A0A7Y2LXR9_9MICO|nr:semialdehyde dehydrogenase [Microbacterium ulmi]NNH02692.1 semialdehyde dehydrogenase [Microbacterium ulmi]